MTDAQGTWFVIITDRSTQNSNKFTGENDARFEVAMDLKS